jgi:hypothetical protein
MLKVFESVGESADIFDDLIDGFMLDFCGRVILIHRPGPRRTQAVEQHVPVLDRAVAIISPRPRRRTMT